MNQLQEIEVKGFVRTFEYALMVGERISREEAFQILEEQIIKERLKWWEENKHRFSKLQCNPLLKAYQVLFIGYILDVNPYLKPDNVPIVKRENKRIIIHSTGYCPVLEACEVLGVDTRELCKWVYEAPTRILLKKVDPRLDFTRNYNCIRPHTDYCGEIILLRE